MLYDAVIFDLDGTLLDTLQDLTDSVNHALTSRGWPARRQDEIRSFVGNGVRRLVARSLPEGMENPDYEAVFALFHEHYAAHCRDTTCPYPHVLELLNGLRKAGLKLAIVSNKSDEEVKKLSEQWFGDLIPVAVGERAGIERKPAPDSLFQVLKELGVSLERAVYVGDSEVDVQTAHNAAMACVAVTWGFRSRTELLAAGAELIVDDTQELLTALLA